MANLTIIVDDEVLKRARVRAKEQGTSVNAVLRDYLEQYAGTRSAQEQALSKPDPIFLDISPASGGMSTNQGGRDEDEAPEGKARG